ncbi:hypothetical protein SmJEL517_g00887 [Synchytrium microbalum]|uniref:Protein kinase domain-containing protein n=1 Tax=Synchytrium microbalum TaxID=1806994 RepID=A0A507CBI6_9FUNG|nr:uncharacterized protein SmJEL517_g00887 [Synchytrium microbalum]TPX36982.1 hypothetical protein SmJEL517_g00887 [Synchytrium microbalum]
MDRYNAIKELGDGSFGSVLLGINKETNEKVAIKKMKQKYATWDECLELRELKSLKQLRNHGNIVNLLEVFRDEHKYLHFVFEYMDSNLYQWLKSRNGKLLPESDAKRISFQVLMGLEHMHKNGYFHRDMKPENLLMKDDNVKIADFGLAREIRSRPPYTEYVSTRWYYSFETFVALPTVSELRQNNNRYRAPEVLLRSTAYSSPIDIWALGTIIAEVFTLKPLLPGNTEMDQIFKMCSLLGSPKSDDDSVAVSAPDYLRLTSPNKNVGGLVGGFTSSIRRDAICGGGPWPEGIRLAATMAFKFPKSPAVPLANICPNVPTPALALIASMLLYDPHKRPTAYQALQSPWLADMYQEALQQQAAVRATEKPQQPTAATTTSGRPSQTTNAEHLPRLDGPRRVPIDSGKELSDRRPPQNEEVKALPSVFQSSSPIRKTSAGSRHPSAKPTSRKSSPRHHAYPPPHPGRRRSGEFDLMGIELAGGGQGGLPKKYRRGLNEHEDLESVMPVVQQQQPSSQFPVSSNTHQVSNISHTKPDARRSPSPEYDIDKLIDEIDDAVASPHDKASGRTSPTKPSFMASIPTQYASRYSHHDFMTRNNSTIPPITRGNNPKSDNGTIPPYGLIGSRTKKSIPSLQGSGSLGSINGLIDQYDHHSAQASPMRAPYQDLGLSLTVRGFPPSQSFKYTNPVSHINYNNNNMNGGGGLLPQATYKTSYHHQQQQPQRKGYDPLLAAAGVSTRGADSFTRSLTQPVRVRR